MKRKFKIEFYSYTNDIIDCETYETEPTLSDYLKLSKSFNSERGDVYSFIDGDEDDTIRYELTFKN
mgnify:CR=1 FL=1